MIYRNLKDRIVNLALKIPVLIITGPRQSGKTTLCIDSFPQYSYFNLESIATRQQIIEDPQGFLGKNKDGMIIDEIQYFPELLSYIQIECDKRNKNGLYILTGSQNFMLMQSASQSLAGRALLFHLLPLSITELKNENLLSLDYEKSIFKGFYPRLYSSDVPIENWLSSYVQLYIERDIRQIINLKDLNKFEIFLKLCAGRIGQLLNYNSLSQELGLDDKTVKSWFSILESSYITFSLQPHYKNFNKRLVKTPKLYFYDTGLASYLLGIHSEEQLQSHYMKGELFENLIISDIKKEIFNKALSRNIYFWRNTTGNEIDCLIEWDTSNKILEIKSSKTFNGAFLKGLKYYSGIAEGIKVEPYLVYGGNDEQKILNSSLMPWHTTNKILGSN